MRLMTVEECSLQAGCLFLFLLQLDLETNEALAHTDAHTHIHSCSVTRPFERSSPAGGTSGSTKMVVSQRKQSLFHTRDTWTEPQGRGRPPSQEDHVCLWLCVCVCGCGRAV